MSRTLPVRINIKDCFILILLIILNTIQISDMANNNMDLRSKEDKIKEDLIEKSISFGEADEYSDCPLEEENILDCNNLHHPCISCDRTLDCQYGKHSNYTCSVKSKVICKGPKTFNISAICRFCYQTDKWEHRCEHKANCNSVSSPLKYYITNCTVSDNIVCLGKRRFLKKIQCSWTGGSRWSTALVLAVTLGGFGADRFYLGHWQEGIGKLFSFGGLGVWTLIDALLIGIHHLGPADGSLYI